MKIPLSLLKSYLELPEPLPVLAETLTLLGLEVDQIVNGAPPFSGVVVGKILSVAPHPEASKLQIARVFDGKNEWQVICGAPNCRAGLSTAFAQIGAQLFDAEGKEIRIGEAKLRGVLSQGMLCSAFELRIPGGHEGILELPSDFAPGDDLLHRLWDPVLEISLTPNLGHCMSALGIARELSASLRRPLRLPKPTVKEKTAKRFDLPFQAKIEAPDLCRRYSLRLIENVKIAPSPFWLQQTLLAAGLRPINNAVDATNYILLKTGQPLHAFDADRIEDRSIRVQTLETTALFHGLDAISYELPPDALLICDEKKTLAIAGVLGGAESAVSEKTTSILLEAASFDPLSVRKTAKQIGVRTESSQRFEKGTDLHAIQDVLDEAVQLIADLCQGEAASGAIDLFGRAVESRSIPLRPDKANSLIGISLSLGEMEEMLRRIDCKIQKEDERLLIEPPTYRNDLQEEVDLIEELARLYGYNNIDRKRPLATLSDLPHDPLFLFEREIRRRMTLLGLQELIHCDLISPSLVQIAPELLYQAEKPIEVLHAKSEEVSILRPSLLPGLLETICFNLDQKNQTLAAFELGRIYLRQERSFSEVPVLAIALYGKRRPHHWEQKPDDVDFYDLKGLLETLTDSLGIALQFTSSRHATFHPGRQADLIHQNERLGSFGEIHPHLLEKLAIKKRVFYAEINLAHLMALKKTAQKMEPLPQYPSTERDWTISLPQGILCKDLFDAIRKIPCPLLEKVELIDLYVQDGEVKRNATFRFTYRDPSKTLSFEEAEAAHVKLIEQATHNSCI